MNNLIPGERGSVDPLEGATLQDPTPTDHRVSDTPGGDGRGRESRPGRLAPVDLAQWLEERLESLSERWAGAIRSQGSGSGPPVDRVIDEFTSHLVRFLPWMLGPYRETVEPLWVRAAELFGSIAARRGLAAGEVIEEFQILRELVIRDLYRDPPLGGRLPLSLREILRLNRGIDRGVTHASVGHTDAMFFQFFESDGVARLSGEHLVDEVLEQLRMNAEELDVVVGHARTVEYAG
ncbi:MAG: hypothetical protein WD995_08375 [Gemmatimonadota bacterium]